jgi:hypothetical protein
LAYSLLKCRLGFVVIAALASGCFTSPVNMRPQVTIRTPPARLYRGQPATFTATVTDPDGETPRLEWEWTGQACALDAIQAPWGVAPTTATDALLLPGGQTRSTFCLRARAVDGAGAEAIDAVTITPDNHPPMPQINISAPQTLTAGGFPVHSAFMLTSEGSTDLDALDALTFTWKLRINDDPPIDVACPNDPGGVHACFTADVPGNYDVELVADDKIDTASIHRMFQVLAGKAPVAILDVGSVADVASFSAQATAGSYQLGTVVRLSGERSMVPDPSFDATFTVTFPDGSARVPDLCVGPSSKLVRCFTASVSGQYLAKLEITSAGNASSASSLLQVAEDRLPCIGITDPSRAAGLPDVLMRTASVLNKFMIKTVDDDLDGGDAAALNKAFFDWLVAEDGKTFTLLGSGPLLQIPPGEFRIGSEIKLRLQIRDRSRDRSDAQFATCGDKDACASTNQCFQRWTWVVRF